MALVQLSHGVWDPHLYTHPSTSRGSLGTLNDINSRVVLSYSGVYNTLYTLGFKTMTQIYSIVLILDMLSVVTLLLGAIHLKVPSWGASRSTFRHLYNTMSVTSHITSPPMHISSQSITLLALGQLLWSTHLIDIQGVTMKGVYPLSFVGGLKSDTSCIMLSDISHHHLALPILLLSLINHTNSLPSKGMAWQMGSTQRPYSSIALSLSLSTHSIRPNIVSQHIYSLPSFSVLSYDFMTSSITYLHHSWISGITTLGSSSHLSIYLIRDHLKDATSTTHISSILTDKSSFLSTISYVTIHLGCHPLGVYIHNDTCISLSYLTYTLSLDPTLCVGVQDLLGKHLSNTSSVLEGGAYIQ